MYYNFVIYQGVFLRFIRLPIDAFSIIFLITFINIIRLYETGYTTGRTVCNPGN